MKRALVTGSSGFLGRHFVRVLVDGGWLVDTVDLMDRRRLRDVRDYLRVAGKQYDLAIHAAAFVGGRRGIEGQHTFLGAYNLQLDGIFFQWALRARPRHVVYLSSSAVYPIVAQTEAAGGMHLHESLVDPRRDVMDQPDATYGLTKLVGERLASELSDEVSDVSVHVVRPFSGYGVDQALEYPFPSFVQRTLERADPFEIWGSGHQVRDWVHVDDVVGATLAVVDQDFIDPVNICTGRPTSFFELAQLFVDSADDSAYSPNLRAVLEAPSGVRFRVGDPTQLLELYTPQISLEEGIRKALNT